MKEFSDCPRGFKWTRFAGLGALQYGQGILNDAEIKIELPEIDEVRGVFRLGLNCRLRKGKGGAKFPLINKGE